MLDQERRWNDLLRGRKIEIHGKVFYKTMLEELNKEWCHPMRRKRPAWIKASTENKGIVVCTDGSKKDENVGAAYAALISGMKQHEYSQGLEDNA